MEKDTEREDEPTIRVMALHALVYCERLYFLEEVEEIRVADEAVWSGRELHEELGEDEAITTIVLESSRLGIRGKVDAVRKRDGTLYPIEHKRGRAMRDHEGKPHAWESDFVQAVAYAMLLEEQADQEIKEARVRYHRDNVTVRIEIGVIEHDMVLEAIERARKLREQIERPPVTEHEGRCMRCSLAPVCLPEEARLAAALREQDPEADLPTPVRYFPPDLERRSLHVLTQGAKVGKSKGKFRITYGKSALDEVGMREVSDITLHGYAQISTQALRACAAEEIPVHWLTFGGAYAGTFFGVRQSVQRKLRQYKALSDPSTCSSLAARLVVAKAEHQLRQLLRSTRKDTSSREDIRPALAGLRRALAKARTCENLASLRGHEGVAAKFYFTAFRELVSPSAGEEMRPEGRSKRPPKDRFNALLSFGYGLLYRDVLAAIVRVGLEPAFGFYHQPRSAAPPLVLDVMELFRVPLVDMAMLGAVNRMSFAPDEDFQVTPKKVWLSDTGRKKAIEVYERRKQEEYKHPALDYSLSYARMLELEVRLLEKEWSGEEGLFATFRFR